MLELSQMDAYYGASHVLRDIDLSVQGGEIVSILGRNGVGKTTLLKSILGLEVRTLGTITLDGKDITGRPTYLRARAGIGYVPQGRELIPDFSIRDNILMGWASSQACGKSRYELLELRSDAVGVGRHQVGGPEPEAAACWVQDRPGRHRGLPAAAGALRCVLFCAAPIPFHGRTRDRRSRPASAFDPRRRRRHRPGTCAGRRGGCRGPVSCGGCATYREHSTRSPALTSTSTSGGKLSRPEPCA